MKSHKVIKQKQTSAEFKSQQARDFGRRALVNAYKSMFPAIPITVIKEPAFIPLADNTPNPYGKIAPPNTPASTVRKVNK